MEVVVTPNNSSVYFCNIKSKLEFEVNVRFCFLFRHKVTLTYYPSFPDTEYNEPQLNLKILGLWRLSVISFTLVPLIKVNFCSLTLE